MGYFPHNQPKLINNQAEIKEMKFEDLDKKKNK